MGKKILITTVIAIAIVVLGGFTYAFYEWSSSETNVGVNVDGLRIIYNGGNSISNANLIPTATKEEGVVKSISVQLDSNQVITPTPSMDLYLDLTTFPSNLADASFIWEVYKDNVLLNSGNFSDKVQGDSIKILDARTITSTLDTYDIYLWINGNMENDSSMQNQTFAFNIHANGINALLADVSVEKLFDIDFDQSGIHTTYDSNDIKNGYVIVGRKDRTSLGTKNDGVISKYDLSGNVEWTTYYGGSDNEYFFKATDAYDTNGNKDGYIVVGEGASYSAIIVKYDLLGNQLWSTTLPDESMADFEDVVPAYDTNGNIDGYIAVGYADLLKTDVSRYRHAVMVKYDLSGNQVWLQKFHDAYDDSFFFFQKVILSYDVSGNVNGYVAVGRGEFSGYDSMIAKYDLSGNRLWLTSYDNGNEDTFNDVTLSYDVNGNVDGYIAVGMSPYSEIYYETNDVNDYYEYGTVIKYDLLGNQVWVKQYTEYKYNSFSNIIDLYDNNNKLNGFAVINTSYLYGNNKKKELVVYDLSGNVMKTYDIKETDDIINSEIYMYNGNVFGAGKNLFYSY